MSIRSACGVMFAAAIVTLGVLPGREHSVVTERGTQVERLEAALALQLASHQPSSATRIELARAYLDAESPGLAWSVLADAPEHERRESASEHMAARVLIEQGEAKEALALERDVLARCDGDVSSSASPSANGCDFWLVVSATRRAGILEELVHQGVEDAIAQPEASLVAYHNATHEARLAVVE